MERTAMGLIVVGVVAAIGPTIYMSIVTSANTTGWGASVQSMYSSVAPIVFVAGFILIILGAAFMRSGHKGI